MQKTRINLILAALMITALFARGEDPVGDIISELMNYTEEPSSAKAAEDKPVAEKKPAPANLPSEALAKEKEKAVAPPPPEKIPAAPAAEEKTTTLSDLDSWDDDATAPQAGGEEILSLSDLDELVEENREKVRGGDFAGALQGFAEIIKIDPENVIARMYLRTLLERDHKTAETEGMETVDAAWSVDMVLRSYTLTADAAEKMQLEDITGSVDVETLFPQVDFPEKSSAIYQPETETIFVYNTPENLAVLDTMLHTMQVLKGSDDAEQVEIEAKFVEVAEGTLEELGFQWNFDDPNPVGIGGSDLDVNDGSGGLFSEALRGSPNNSAGGRLPFSRPAELGDGTKAAEGQWSTFRFEDTFNTAPSDMRIRYTGGNAFDVLISALDQSTGADVLSAPRILTRSGEKASIRVGELHYFPEVYESDSSQATIVNISYEDFEEKLLGVELTVIPKVRDEREITLKLNPRISELAGWQSYQLAPANSIYNHRQRDLNRRYVHPEIAARLPVFKKREIETEVTIADGSTIGMGGLINEKVEAFEDKVPVLGHIPLVGRLFRNEGERTVKRNLLMFVTAKIVEPNGRVNTTRSFE